MQAWRAWRSVPYLYLVGEGDGDNALPRGGDNETTMAETLGQMLKRLIIEAGTTPEKLAEALGQEPTAGTIKKIMKGQVRNPGVKTLERIAVGLGVQPEMIWRAATSGEIEDDVKPVDLMAYEVFVNRKFADDKETRDKLLAEYRWLRQRRGVSSASEGGY